MATAAATVAGNPTDIRKQSNTIAYMAPKTLPTIGKYDMPRIKKPGCKSIQLGDGRRVMNIHMVKKVRNSDWKLSVAPLPSVPEMKAWISEEIWDLLVAL
mmetsp:Transcript_22979/g.49722  ORF Transcript_22979/g.49722 Transcript_22979/m.49722 type:complete len:100 (+) Transcript_22979:1106-1405(+)